MTLSDDIKWRIYWKGKKGTNTPKTLSYNKILGIENNQNKSFFVEKFQAWQWIWWQLKINSFFSEVTLKKK